MASKILILSHNPLCTYNNMGKTLLQLFSEAEKERLCQIYLYPSLPDDDRCASVFRITDKDVLRSFAPPFRVSGRTVASAPAQCFEHPTDAALYQNPRNKRPLRMLLRDAMWRCARWDNWALRQWLDEQAPSCIFAAPGDGAFFYRIALRLARERGIPLISYFCDDYYFWRPKGARLQHRHLRRAMEALVAASAQVIAISEPLAARYRQQFGCPVEVIMTGSGIPYGELSRLRPESLLYAGNINCGRFRSLCEVAETLDALNEAHGTAFPLEIYTGERDPALLAQLSAARSVRLHPFVTGEAFRRVFDAARLHLHVESFAPADIARVYGSVSTKLADCLASGKPLLAYGPAEVASMRHLQGCALTATSRESLHAVLEQAFFEPEAAYTAAENGLKLAKRCHDRRENSRRVLELVKRAEAAG